jgi:hypothetical protein
MNITLCTRDFISVFVLSQQNNLRSERQHFRIRVRFRFFPDFILLDPFNRAKKVQCFPELYLYPAKNFCLQK